MIEGILLLLVLLVVVWILIRSLSVGIKYYEETVKGERPTNFFSPKPCERCGKLTSWTARLTSFRQSLLGGWTCPACGSEYDQVGNLRIARSLDAHLRDARTRSKKRKTLRIDESTPVEKVIDE